MIYGMLLLSLVYGATALSLAELSARYPSAGGQYHWTSILAPLQLRRALVGISDRQTYLILTYTRVIAVQSQILLGASLSVQGSQSLMLSSFWD